MRDSYNTFLSFTSIRYFIQNNSTHEINALLFQELEQLNTADIRNLQLPPLLNLLPDGWLVRFKFSFIHDLLHDQFSFSTLLSPF